MKLQFEVNCISEDKRHLYLRRQVQFQCLAYYKQVKCNNNAERYHNTIKTTILTTSKSKQALFDKLAVSKDTSCLSGR